MYRFDLSDRIRIAQIIFGNTNSCCWTIFFAFQTFVCTISSLGGILPISLMRCGLVSFSGSNGHATMYRQKTISYSFKFIFYFYLYYIHLYTCVSFAPLALLKILADLRSVSERVERFYIKHSVVSATEIDKVDGFVKRVVCQQLCFSW